MLSKNPYELSIEKWREWAKNLKQPPYRGNQIFSWLHKRLLVNSNQMTDIPEELREQFNSDFPIILPPVKRKVEDEDIVKYLLELADGELVECVAISEFQKGYTACLSTQIGCSLSCAFCASGRGGVVRNLTSGEILAQLYTMLNDNPDLDNIVFMGMGEPMLNYDNLMVAIRTITHPDGLKFGARRITVSTAGIVPEIYRLASEGLQVNLAISLNASNQKQREQIMPVARLYQWESIFDAVKEYIKATNRRVTFEYVLLKGINDQPKDAQKLARSLPRLAHVNLISCNPIPDCPHKSPPISQITAFKLRIAGLGVQVTIRRSKGRDSDAACGQLRRRNI
jgi:23S rRNA (adenine2503-C2)-methyltransferase